MLYWVLRWISRIALRWYYRDVRVVGYERIPTSGPVIFAANHPNALVDALVTGCVIPRRLRLTGKATLFGNQLLAPLLRSAGVVPLRRASDEDLHARTRGTAAPDPSRNAESFRALVDVLAGGGAMLIFPEGKSHSDPALAPLKTGAARIALEARDLRGVRHLTIVPVGIVFEQKERPRSRVVVQIGEPLQVDDVPARGAEAVAHLTAAVESGLRAVTLNFESPAHAERVLGLADVMSALVAPPRRLGAADPSLLAVLDTLRRIERARRAIAESSAPVLEGRVARFLERVDALEVQLREHGLLASDIGINPSVRAGLGFALRESAILAAVGPAALWGRLNHWIPLRAARALALRRADAPDQPAMRSLVIGLLLVLAAYTVQTAIVVQLAGAAPGIVYLLSLPVSAEWDLRLADRTRRAAARIRAYLLFRRAPALHAALLAGATAIRAEALELERLVMAAEDSLAAATGDRPDPSATPRDASLSAGP